MSSWVPSRPVPHGSDSGTPDPTVDDTGRFRVYFFDTVPRCHWSSRRLSLEETRWVHMRPSFYHPRVKELHNQR